MLNSEARALAVELMGRHGLTDWSFAFDRAKKRFGCCSHKRKTISLSAVITPHQSEDLVRDTILHEIAHALCGPSVGHGWRWKVKCSEIGARPVRCGKVVPKEVARKHAKLLLVCKACGHEEARYKRPRVGVSYSCGICSPKRFNRKFLLEIKPC